MATRKADRCKVPGCNRPHHARGYCQNCYDELRKKKKAHTVKSHLGNRKKDRPTKSREQHSKANAPLVQDAGGKSNDGRKRTGAASTAAKPLDENQKSTRLGLIKLRHEAMKREIDQIREDLESDEEE